MSWRKKTDRNLHYNFTSKSSNLLVKNNEHLQRTKPLNGKVVLSSVNAPAVYGAETAPIADEDGRAGWLFKKVATGTAKFNYYFYGEGNTALTLENLNNMNAIISVDRYDNVSSVPFLVVYTKLTGSGDAGSWYHSKKTYVLDATENLQVGELCEIYSENRPAFKGYRQIKLNYLITEGDCADSEEIYTLSIHSGSEALINTKILVQSVGFDTNDGISRNMELSS